jgi:predicted secreted protein
MAAAASAFAGDYADLEVIGFSKDGRYLAFEESGAWDGSGGDYATTYYIDTSKNMYAAAPTIFQSSFDPSEKTEGFRSLRLYKQSVATRLKRFGIIRGNNGSLRAAHLLSDMSFVPPVERPHLFYEEGKNEPITKPVTDYEGAFIRRDTTEPDKVIFSSNIDAYNQNTQEFFELTLTPAKAKGPECSEAYRFTLTLKDQSHNRISVSRLLQYDAESLPKARNCPFGYKIERVYVYQNVVAVFINVFSQGFEGPDMRYMVVTGALTDKW